MVPLLALLAAGAPALAQSYPARPVTIVVPFPAGGSVDGVARILAQELQERSGRAFVVENRAGGAGGTVGSASVATATADGYTLLLNASIHVVQPLINPNVRYDVVKDFAHIALVASGPLLVTTHPSVPVTTLRAFFDALKADPKRYVIATTGQGSAGHLTVEFLKQQAGVETPIVPYRGAGPALNDLLGGHIHLVADPMLSSLPNVTAGTLKALAVTSAKRSPLAPNVPTVAESGMPPFEMLSWYGLWAPKGIGAEVQAFLAREVAAVATSPRLRERLTPLGFEPTYRDGAGLEAYVVEEMTKYAPIVKAAGIKVQ
jgi:tripartite-type tricarboxylate transporter receptor subunit TctC